MDITSQIINIFKTILSAMPKKAFEVQDCSSLMEVFENVLVNLGYAANIISLVIFVLKILWDIFKFVKGLVAGKSVSSSIQG